MKRVLPVGEICVRSVSCRFLCNEVYAVRQRNKIIAYLENQTCVQKCCFFGLYMWVDGVWTRSRKLWVRAAVRNERSHVVRHRQVYSALKVQRWVWWGSVPGAWVMCLWFSAPQIMPCHCFLCFSKLRLEHCLGETIRGKAGVCSLKCRYLRLVPGLADSESQQRHLCC